MIVHSAGGALGLEHTRRRPTRRSGGDVRVQRPSGSRASPRRCCRPLRRAATGTWSCSGSVAGVEVYPGGAGYTAAKHAVNALAQDPGASSRSTKHHPRSRRSPPGWSRPSSRSSASKATRERADAVYDGLKPLSATDVAEVIAFVVTRPPHVNIDYVGHQANRAGDRDGRAPHLDSVGEQQRSALQAEQGDQGGGDAPGATPTWAGARRPAREADPADRRLVGDRRGRRREARRRGRDGGPGGASRATARRGRRADRPPRGRGDRDAARTCATWKPSTSSSRTPAWSTS